MHYFTSSALAHPGVSPPPLGPLARLQVSDPDFEGGGGGGDSGGFSHGNEKLVAISSPLANAPVNRMSNGANELPHLPAIPSSPSRAAGR